MISEEHYGMLVPVDRPWKERKPQPGDRVSLIVVEGDYEKLTGCGMLIAVVGTRAQVMWSKLPDVLAYHPFPKIAKQIITEYGRRLLAAQRERLEPHVELKVLKYRSIDPIEHITLDIKFNDLQTEASE